ncbi:MAG: hypothetical protein JW908_11665 [Anaerolineales bacterium]|nr:hypothetical protein [Anaerolineales bacterium]
MDILKRKDIMSLMEISGDWCISLYMPTHRFGKAQQQDPIRLKNLVTQAQDMLLMYGLRMPDVQELMQPIEKLQLNRHFWDHQSDGLAIFLTANFFRTYRLPARFDDFVLVSKFFHVKPLLPLLSGDGQYYILAISMNEIRLMLGTRDTIDTVDLEGVPTNMQEALWMNDPEKHLGFRTSVSSSGREGLRRSVFHGHGAKSDERKKVDILRYFQSVDKGIISLLDDQTIPMVLVGVDYLLPIYHQANTYAGLLDEGLEGNPEQVSEKDLQQSTWELVEPIFTKNKEQAREKFELLHSQKSLLASNDLETVVKKARHGQVETLMVSLGLQKWGRYDTHHDAVVIEPDPNPENRDLLDFAVEETLVNSGKVYAFPLEEMPGGECVAAILRYAS